MSLRRPLGVALACLILVACDRPGPSGPASSADLAVFSAGTAGNLGASGGGYYDILGLRVQFAFTAVQTPKGTATGHFRIFADEGGGLTVDVSGQVICMAEDPVNHRAWIGAVVTRNASTDPDLQTDIHEVGDDVWFRVLDGGEGAGAVDRTSFTGFKGAAGLDTSPQYCAARIWPDDNARTWPVTEGNISVRP